MSIYGLKDYQRTSHRRDNSDEIDVFEAARYYNDNFALVDGPNMIPKMAMKEETKGYLRGTGRRISLDIPSLKHYPITQPENRHNQPPQQIKQKKYKQPSSPGGKLAHFLTSIFNQTTSKKNNKSSKLSSSQSVKDEDESPNGRRKRRSSISHFRSSTSSSTSEFRNTSSPYNLNTPTKYYKDLTKPIDENIIRGSKLDWTDEYLKFSEKPKNKSNHNGYEVKNRGMKKINEGLLLNDDDDGAESDSSSDLFELQIGNEFGFCSSGLPVYETTHMDNIKRSSTLQL